MPRRIDEIKDWHCPHPCTCREDHEKQMVAQGTAYASKSFRVRAAKAWRYAIVKRDTAFCLTVSPGGGMFALHRAFSLPGDQEARAQCDLLGRSCVIEVDDEVVAEADETTDPVKTGEDRALLWWAEHAKQGTLEQPEAFWRALEKLAREWVREASKKRYARVLCPRCGYAGFGR
jgi:predicted nucleic-acid-binding Zn-ribbon protein